MIKCKRKSVTIDGAGAEVMEELALIMVTLRNAGINNATLHRCVEYAEEMKDAGIEVVKRKKWEIEK